MTFEQNNGLLHILKSDRYSVLSILLVILCLISGYTQSYAVGICCIAFSLLMFNRVEYLIPSLLITSLVGDYFVALPGNSIARILSLIIFGGAILRLNKAYSVRFGMWILVILIYCLFSSLTSITGDIQPYFKLVINIIVVFSLAQLRGVNTSKLMMLIYYASILTSLYFLMSFYSGNMSQMYDRVSISDNITSNRSAMVYAQLSATIFGYMICRWRFSTLGFLAIMSNFVMILHSGSRTSFIAFSVGALLIYFFSMVKLRRLKLSSLVIVSSVILVGLFAFNYVKQTSDVMQRFSVDDVVESGGTGRSESWEIAIDNIIPENFFFGVGYGGDSELAAIRTYNRDGHQSHNLIFSLLIQIGVIGCLIFVMFYSKVLGFITVRLRTEPELFIPFSILVIGLINGIGETVYDEKFIWNAIALAVMFNVNNMSTPVSQTNNLR